MKKLTTRLLRQLALALRPTFPQSHNASSEQLFV